jgi:dTDP-4-amino-4,6-dideoxygalactose transaminase
MPKTSEASQTNFNSNRLPSTEASRAKINEVAFQAVSREHQTFSEEIRHAFNLVLASGRMLQSAEISQLENQLAVRCNRRFAVAVGSCTDALFFALRASEVQAGDEVLVTDFSFGASATCIRRLGAVPRFVDIDPQTCLMDLHRAEQLLTPKTTAIVAVHLYGNMIPPKEIVDFARSHRLHLIEDAAQALGAEFDGEPAGSLGLASCLSFDPTKNLSAPGSGGMVLTDDERVARGIRSLRYHGIDAEGWHRELGYNSQMPSLTAAMLLVKLRHFDEMQRLRGEIASEYLQGFRDLPIAIPRRDEKSRSSWHKFVIQSDRRNDLQAFLLASGIATKVHYPFALRRHPLFATTTDMDHESNSDLCARTVLSLPIFPYLTTAECAHVVESVREFFNKQ